MRGIDFHVHLPTREWLDGAIGPYRRSTEAYFRVEVSLKSVEEVAEEYRELGLVGVVLAWDAETATGLPPLTNDFVAGIVKRFPEVFIGFASVDPWKGKRALAELERAREMGLVGAKFHPSIQAFRPDDPRHFPLWETCTRLGMPAVFHTGTSGVGAGTPGGMGIRLEPSRPIHLDTVAAEFPEFQIVMAHFGWPWHLESLAIALHKANVWLDLSGWLPKYIPAEVLREARTRLKGRVLFGSDYPLISPSRWIEEMDRLEFPDDAREALMSGAARRLLELAGARLPG